MCDILGTTPAQMMGNVPEKTVDIKSGNDLPVNFDNPKDAMEFLLKLPTVAAYGGYDPSKMDDETMVAFANEILQQLQIQEGGKMRAKEIKNLAEDLRENYNTRNPFELADKFGIKVLISKVLPADKKAYTIKSDNYPTIIIVNGRYEYKSQMVLCAHELGHALLHSDAVNNFAVTSKNAFKNVEYEANLFAVSLLFDEEDFNIKMLNMSNYLLKQVLDYNIEEK